MLYFLNENTIFKFNNFQNPSSFFNYFPGLFFFFSLKPNRTNEQNKKTPYQDYPVTKGNKHLNENMKTKKHSEIHVTKVDH